MTGYKIDFIVCCGMPRSGSTLQYQIVKEILSLNGLESNHGWIKDEDLEYFFKENKSNSTKPILVKTHTFNPIFLDKEIFSNSLFIYVHRDVRDVFISQMNKRSVSFDFLLKSRFLEDIEWHFKNWMDFDEIYTTNYQNLTKNTVQEILSLASHLKLDMTDSKAEYISEGFNIEKQKKYISKIGDDNVFDSESLLHKNHINSGESNQWKQLSKKEIILLEAKAKTILDAQGFQSVSNSLLFKLKSKLLFF